MAEDSHAAVRDVLVVLLTLTTGAVDATCFLHLGDVFSSVITGNMVLLGIAAGSGQPGLALHSGVALLGYSTGVVVGAPIAASRPPSAQAWPASVTAALMVEIGALGVFSAGWEVAGGKPAAVAQLLLVAVLGVAMGIQSAAVRQLGAMSTTYLTGTLTGVIAAAVTRRADPDRWRSTGVLAAAIAGAVAGAAASSLAPDWTPVVVLTPVAAVVIAALTRFEPVRLGPGRRRDR